MWGSPPGGDWAGVESWTLLGGEDRVATECTRDEQLPVLQGQVPLHKHVQGDLVVDQALPVAEEETESGPALPHPAPSCFCPLTFASAVPGPLASQSYGQREQQIPPGHHRDAGNTCPGCQKG